MPAGTSIVYRGPVLTLYTPSATPAGSAVLTDAVTALLRKNGLRDVDYAEPFEAAPVSL